MAKNDNKMAAWKGLAMVSQLGINMTVCVLGGVLLGRFLDNLLNTGGILVMVFIVLGVVIGFMNIYKMIMQGMRK